MTVDNSHGTLKKFNL